MVANKERVRGKERVHLIEQVQKDKPLINMRVPARDYEILTVIDGIEISKKGNVFAVDVPEDVRKGFDEEDACPLEFEFVDANDVPCTFTSSSAGISDDKVWILFPEVIYREQKREHFRVEVPLEASLRFSRDDMTYLLNVSNISMGGMLITVRTGKKDAPFLGVGEKLQDAEFVLTSGSIHIQAAEVAWVDEGASMSTVQMGIQFTRIDRDQRCLLRDTVYELQREFLARRAGTA